MAIIVESPAPSYNVLMAILGAVVAAISVVMYYVSQKKVLNYLEELWSIAHFWKSILLFIKLPCLKPLPLSEEPCSQVVSSASGSVTVTSQASVPLVPKYSC